MHPAGRDTSSRPCPYSCIGVACATWHPGLVQAHPVPLLTPALRLSLALPTPFSLLVRPLPPSLPTEMNEALGLLTGAFANISIKGRQVGLPAPGHTPAFALRGNAGGQGKAGKPTGACGVACLRVVSPLTRSRG